MFTLFALLSACHDRGDTDGDGALDAEDCAPLNLLVHPGADEVCNGLDDDCDDAADEGLATLTAYADSDGDGYGDPATAHAACELLGGDRDNDHDCDDRSAAVYPGAAERCDGVDDDCDGLVDAADPDVVDALLVLPDADGDGFGDASADPVRACETPAGMTSDSTDCDDADAAVRPDAPEVCDGIDDDCDGLIDDADPGVADGAPWWPDADGDGHGDLAAEPTYRCTAPAGSLPDADDCDDLRTDIHPDAPHPPCSDGIDYDCDGLVEDDDVDGDGWSACADCVESDAAVHPGALEDCNGRDDDCDGLVDADDGLPLYTSYYDADSDGYGDAARSQTDCEVDRGWVLVDGDCDIADCAVYPGAPETCDGVDDDCDGAVDEDAGTTVLYLDADEDGYGDPEVRGVACDGAPGWSVYGTDCDDTNASVSPGDKERCATEVDDDCDGTVNEPGAADAVDYVVDADGDGHGDPAWPPENLCGPEGSYTLRDSRRDDCDDTDPTVYPEALDPCADGLDTDCDGFDDCADTDLLLLLHGPATGAGLGRALDYGADLDGDGVGDLVVSAPGGGAGARQVHLYAGPLSLGLGAPFASVASAGTGNQYGWSVATGDGDGDGFADLYVGDPSLTDSTRGLYGELVWLPGPVTATDFTPAAGRWWGDGYGSTVGASFAWGGDVTGDGAPDLLVAEEQGAAAPEGLVYVLPAGSAFDRPASSTDTFVVSGTDERIGTPVVGGADLDGDGADDAVVTGSRSLSVLHGPLSGVQTLEEGDVRLDPTEVTSLRILDDLNGDGLPELGVGDATGCFILSGDSGRTTTAADALVTVVIEEDRDLYVAPLRWSTGTLDGDDSADLAIGHTNADADPYQTGYEGQISIFFGPLSGTRSAADADFYRQGAYGGERLGLGADVLGDVDGDGRDDLVVAGYQNADTDNMAGVLYALPSALLP